MEMVKSIDPKSIVRGQLSVVRGPKQKDRRQMTEDSEPQAVVMLKVGRAAFDRLRPLGWRQSELKRRRGETEKGEKGAHN
jgi:hypothetical protein